MRRAAAGRKGERQRGGTAYHGPGVAESLHAGVHFREDYLSKAGWRSPDLSSSPNRPTSAGPSQAKLQLPRYARHMTCNKLRRTRCAEARRRPVTYNPGVSQLNVRHITRFAENTRQLAC